MSDHEELVDRQTERIDAYKDDPFLQHIEKLVASGKWNTLKPYLRKALSIAEQQKIPEFLVRTRFAVGACILCGREPCNHCGTKNPLWCEVCWKLIQDNCPEGKVVSGLAWVVQHITQRGLDRTLDA